VKKAIQKNALILAAFAIACTAVVGVVDLITKDKIALQKQRYLLKTLNEIIPPEKHDNNLYQTCTSFVDGNGNAQKRYLATKGDSPVAVALTATAPDGYNGNISLIVAINTDNSVSGVRVIDHKETPGLGDKIELRKSQWITSFSGKKLEGEKDSRWKVVKDGGMFDQFTGATITPRAIVKAVKESILYFEKNRQSLLNNVNTCQGDK